jgi:hypothetical protein
MAPFIANISEIRPIDDLSDGEMKILVEREEEVSFQARVDDEWLVVNVPNGGKELFQSKHLLVRFLAL